MGERFFIDFSSDSKVPFVTFTLLQGFSYSLHSAFNSSGLAALKSRWNFWTDSYLRWLFNTHMCVFSFIFHDRRRWRLQYFSTETWKSSFEEKNLVLVSVKLCQQIGKCRNITQKCNTAIALNSVKCAKHFLIIHSKTGDIILTVICFLRYVSIK